MHIYKKKGQIYKKSPGGGRQKLSGGTYLEHDCESLRDAIVCFYRADKKVGWGKWALFSGFWLMQKGWESLRLYGGSGIWSG